MFITSLDQKNVPGVQNVTQDKHRKHRNITKMTGAKQHATFCVMVHSEHYTSPAKKKKDKRVKLFWIGLQNNGMMFFQIVAIFRGNAFGGSLNW